MEAKKIVLNVNGIEVIYNHVILVLKGVSLNVPDGKIVAILGGNGAGKTTTLRAVSNLLRGERGEVTKGSIELRGERIENLSPADLVQRGVVQVMEGRHCFAHLTIEENLLTGSYTRRDKGEIAANLDKVYTYFPRLKTRRSSQAAYTSGGEQQMCAIGRALMANPSMVLLDEPSMGLAPQIVQEVFEIVKDLNTKEKVTFLLAEQNTNMALKYADYGYIMESGRVVMDGIASDLANNEDVKEFYLGMGGGERKSLKDVNPAAVTSRAALAGLPVTRKHELLALQLSSRSRGASVFGGFSTAGFGVNLPRVFASPGPIYEPEGTARDYWRMARAIFAAGFRPGELIHNSFSYHFVPAGSMMETGAHALGCTVFPGGTGQTEQQVQAMAELKPAGYIGTPSFLKIIVEKAADMGVALPSLTKAMFGGEAFPPSLRDWFTKRGIAGYQCYATADMGSIAYETSAREGLVLDEGVILEIVRPGTGDPVAEGEVGEVVVTTLNPIYPLIRFC